MSEFTLPPVPPPPKPKAKPIAQQSNSLLARNDNLQSNVVQNDSDINMQADINVQVDSDAQENFDDKLSENIAESTAENTGNLDRLENLESSENSENIVSLEELEDEQIENAEFCEWHLPGMFDANYIDPFSVPADYLIAKDLNQLRVIWEEFSKTLDQISTENETEAKDLH